MAKEIERKFLVKSEDWKTKAYRKMDFVQGYFSSDHPTLRIRISGEKAWLTIKGRTEGISRSEHEYEIPLLDAQDMIVRFCDDRVISKQRHLVRYGEHTWEVDEFLGRHEGLVVAEIELGAEDEFFERPDWLGREVSGEVAYYNQVLAKENEKRPN